MSYVTICLPLLTKQKLKVFYFYFFFHHVVKIHPNLVGIFRKNNELLCNNALHYDIEEHFYRVVIHTIFTIFFL